MKRHLPFLCAALLVAGCTKDDTQPAVPQQSGSITVTATTDCVRTILDEGESAASVVWEDGDEIGVFTMSDKTNGTNNRLRIERGGSTVGRFSGWLHQDVLSNDIYFACYPYDGRAEFYYDSDRTMILYAPSVQHRTGEGFDCRNCGFMVATAKTGMMYDETASFAFKNLFAILKFTLTGSGETLHRINVFGNDGEPMAGQFYVELTDSGAADPSMRFNAGGFYSAPFDSTTVTLDCNTVLTSEPKSFYVAVPPQTYVYGYSAEFETSAGAMIRSNGITTGKTLRRSTIYNHPQEKFAADYPIGLRSTADWLWQTSGNTIRNVALQTGASGRDLSAGNRCANCYIVTEAGDYCFRASRPDGTALWGTPADACITFSVDEAAAAKGGNALVALFDDENNVLWSWHIWIPREDPRASHHYAGGSNELMNMNLGALCSTPDDPDSYGLYYQWGRKDPFAGNGEAGETVNGYREDTAFGEVAWIVNPNRSAAYSFRTIANDDSRIPVGRSVEYATAHPTTMICYSSNIHDGDPSGEDTAHLQSGSGTWFNSYYVKFCSLWGYEHGTQTNRKTIYDPCPAGYKVPDRYDGTWTGFGNSTPAGSLKGFRCNGAYYPPAGCRDGWDTAGNGGRMRYSGYSAYYLTSKPSVSYCEVLATSIRGSMYWYPASAGVLRCVKE